VKLLPGGVDYFYSATNRRSRAASWSIFAPPRTVHPDLLSSRIGYVAVSRASHEASIFTDDVTRLTQQLGTEVTKTAALAINRSVSMGLGMD
jgi:hypothetical protein